MVTRKGIQREAKLENCLTLADEDKHDDDVLVDELGVELGALGLGAEIYCI